MSENEQARQNLKKWMETNGYSYRRLAEPLDISHTFISKILAGERPITDAFRWKFANAFGYETAIELFGASVEPEVTA